jgi:hypothetical protein
MLPSAVAAPILAPYRMRVKAKWLSYSTAGNDWPNNRLKKS